MELMTTSWDYLPPEIQLMILEALLQDGCRVGALAAVSRQWQTIIEPHNFRRIKLTPSRLSKLNAMTVRNRSLVTYLWLHIETDKHTNYGLIRDTKAPAAFNNLLRALSTWEPNGDLVLDISFDTSGGSERCPPFLAFQPDLLPSECDRTHWVEEEEEESHEATLASINKDRSHSCLHLSWGRLCWWDNLPPAPAVTKLLLRQQNSLQWEPFELQGLLSSLPNVQEIHYEPWRRCPYLSALVDESYWDVFFDPVFLMRFIGQSRKRLIVFENFSDRFPATFVGDERYQGLCARVTRTFAKASAKLELLSLSYLADASHFFDACPSPMKWPNMTSLALTSEVLTPNEDQSAKINEMLLSAAKAAERMPNLQTMEIWNGGKGVAGLFRYQSKPGIITWRGTWDLALEPDVVQAWENIASQQHGERFKIVKCLLDESKIKCHDANGAETLRKAQHRPAFPYLADMTAMFQGILRKPRHPSSFGFDSTSFILRSLGHTVAKITIRAGNGETVAFETIVNGTLARLKDAAASSMAATYLHGE